MRPSQPNQKSSRAAATLPTQRPEMISGVCSQCGTTYEVEDRGGKELWLCPRCGPSIPISGKESPSAPRRRRRLPIRLPRVRVPYAVVQFLLVSVTFVLFLVVVTSRMKGPSPRTSQTRERARSEAALSGHRSDRDRQDGPVGAANPRGTDSGQSEVAVTAAAPQIDEPSVGAEPAGGRADDANRTADRAEDTSPQLASASSLPGRRTDVPADWTPPLQVPKGNSTVRKIIDNSLRMFGRQFVLQCRLIGVYDDAVGRVPHRFDIGDQQFTLSDADDTDFVRLEVADISGERLKSLFVAKSGNLEQELGWLRPGDWIVVSATPGVRYDPPSTGTNWGLILTEIKALDENTHSTGAPGPKRWAER